MKEIIDLNEFDGVFKLSDIDALYYIEVPSGKHIYISKSAESIFGYTPEEFYDTPLLIKKLIHKNFISYFDEKWTDIKNGKSEPFYEYQIVDKSGNLKWINQRNYLQKDHNGKTIAVKGIISDITNYKNIELDLELSRKRFEEILQTSTDWVWEVDQNGVYTYVSDRVEDFLGYSADEVIGKTPFDTMSEDEAKRVSEEFLKYVSVQQPFKDLENTNIHKSGCEVIISTSGFPIYDSNEKFIGYRGTDRDITEIKNLIQNLNKAQELANIGHWEYDLLSNELYWSDEVYRIFGLKPQEVKATYETFLNFIHPEDQEKVDSAYKNSLQTKSEYNIKHRIITAKKDIKYVEERCVHHLNNDGEVVKSIGTVNDITKQVEDEKDLKIAANVYKHSSDAIVITDQNNDIVSVNKSFEKLTGYKAEELLGKNPRIFSSGWGDKEFYEDMWNSLKEKNIWHSELWDRKKDGTLYATNISIICVRDENGEVLNYIAISRDITESKNREKAIHQLAYYDFLTKLPNRRLFQQEVESFIKSSHYSSKKFAILFLDLDNFKWVNDSLGHAIGDRLLIVISKFLRKCVSEDSIISRLGGDEFVVIAPFDSKLEISKLATNILSTVAEPIIINEKEINVGWSIGISVYPDNAKTYTDLLKSADTAMYIAKENGKNNFRYYNDSMNKEAVERMNIDTRLRSAIKNSSFTLNYQPKYSCSDQSIKGLEALIRWNDEELGFVPPDKFIPIAEESGYMRDIGEWVLKQSLSDLKRIHKETKTMISMAINISGKQLDESDFYENTKNIIQELDVDSKYIEFEITETSVMKDINKSIKMLEKIKELGISISIDDFGTGYSSLAYLKKLPIDTLKIDREFVSELDSSEESHSIVSATIALSKALKLKTIAEGVEIVEQKNILQSLGCTMIQGYLYSKPLEIASLIELILNECYNDKNR